MVSGPQPLSSLLPVLFSTLAPAAHPRTFAHASPAAWVPFPLLLAIPTSAESCSLGDQFPELVGGDFTSREVVGHSLPLPLGGPPGQGQGLYGPPTPPANKLYEGGTGSGVL